MLESSSNHSYSRDLLPGEENQEASVFLTNWVHPKNRCSVARRTHKEHKTSITAYGYSALEVELAIQYLPGQIDPPKCGECGIDYLFVSAQPD